MGKGEQGSPWTRAGKGRRAWRPLSYTWSLGLKVVKISIIKEVPEGGQVGARLCRDRHWCRGAGEGVAEEGVGGGSLSVA